MTWERGTPVHLETERLFIRSLEPSDVGERMLAWYRDPKVAGNLYMVGEMTREKLLAYLRGFDNAANFFLGIFEREGGRHIGYFRVNGNLKHRHGFATTVIGERDRQARGVSREARVAAFDFLFGPAGFHRLIATTYPGNEASFRAIEALGFRAEGVLRDHDIGPDGERRDVHVFGLLASEWRAHRQQWKS